MATSTHPRSGKGFVGFDDDDVKGKLEDEGDAFDKEHSTRGVNVWDSVTLLFRGPSVQQQRQQPQPPQNQQPRHSRPRHQQPRQEARALDGDDRPPRGAIEPLDKNDSKRTPSGSHASSSDDGDGSVASSISSHGDFADESNGEEENFRGRVEHGRHQRG